MFEIRKYHPGDEVDIQKIFYDTVHEVNIKDYNQKQVDTWAKKNPNLNKWREGLSKNYSYVAIDSSSKEIIGFSDLQPDGLLNRGYVRKDWLGKGVGKALLKVREKKAKELGFRELRSEVSITAKPFFLSQGYEIIKEQVVTFDGVEFVNYLMKKEL